MKRIILDKPGKKDVVVEFKKMGEDSEFFGIVKATKPGDYILNVTADHLVGKTNGRVVIRGIAKNGARIAVTGMVKIREGANQVDDFLEMRILILDDKSQATVEPRLEIEANDVKASHAAAVGKIDEEQMFYLMSRGMEREAAEKLIVDGFLAEVTNINNSRTSP